MTVLHHQDQEAAVAGAMVASLIVGWTSADVVVPNEIIAEHFGRACEQLGFVPDETSARRILQTVSRDLIQRRRAVDEFNNVLLRETRRLRRRSR